MIGQGWKERTCFGGGGFEWPQPFHEWRAVIWDEPTYNLCVKKGWDSKEVSKDGNLNRSSVSKMKYTYLLES